MKKFKSKLSVMEILARVNGYLWEWGANPIAYEDAERWITGRESSEEDIKEIAANIYNTN